MKRYKSKRLLIIILFAVLAIECIVLYLFLSPSSNKSNKNTVIDDSVLFDKWIENKNKNEDYICQLFVDSGSIDVPVVQAKGISNENGENKSYSFFDEYGNTITDLEEHSLNDVYKWMDFETMTFDYDKNGGTVYMDSNNNRDDQNLIIYGHVFSKNSKEDIKREKGFAYLEKFLNQKDYENDSIVKLVFDDEIRAYKLYAVYEYLPNNTQYNETCQYNLTTYTDIYDDSTVIVDMFDKYFGFVDTIKKFDTGMVINNKDCFLTLVCDPVPTTDKIEICVYKLSYTETYQYFDNVQD